MEEKKGSKKFCVVGCLLVVLLGVGGIGACVWSVFMVTAPVAEASELFLTRISEEVDERWQHLVRSSDEDRKDRVQLVEWPGE